MIEDDFDIKKKVEEVLNETGFTDQRAAKMGVDDLLKCVCFTSHGRIVAELNLQAAIGIPRRGHSFRVIFPCNLSRGTWFVQKYGILCVVIQSLPWRAFWRVGVPMFSSLRSKESELRGEVNTPEQPRSLIPEHLSRRRCRRLCLLLRHVRFVLLRRQRFLPLKISIKSQRQSADAPG